MSGIFDSNPARCGGVFLTWKDLSVSIPQGYGIRRFLLHNVTGYAEPGELVAVMGPSGSGKTTLLDALAGRLSSITNQSGEILVNGRRQLLTYGNSAYVPQDDSLIETLTVYETIVYSAQLQLPKTMPMVEKAARVGSVVEEMGLQDCVHTKIGGWRKNGLSGGEKRRVSIAIEILTRPRLLFLDEPTSGLDSAAAFLVMRKLKQLVTDGRTLIVTIHQPSSEVFMLFHSLCLLSSGKTIYFGEARKAQQFFTESGFPCSTFRNPSDHFLWVIKSELEGDMEMGDLIGNIEGREMGDLSQNVNPVHRTDSLVHAYSSSETALEVKAAIQNISSKGQLEALPFG